MADVESGWGKAMTRTRSLFMGVVGVVMVGASVGCGSDPAAPEAAVALPDAVTYDVALRVEGMT